MTQECAPFGIVMVATVVATAFAMAAATLGRDLTITSGTDGEHSGPNDPHHRGHALDVRSHDVPADLKGRVLALVMEELQRVSARDGADAALVATSGGWACGLYFGFLEAPGRPHEHFHVQLRRGRTLSMPSTTVNSRA
jgi:hypothetical protein